MAQISPLIQDGILTDLRDGSPVQVVVDSSDWYTWLQTASTFTFRGEQGSFTAHKERAGNRRGSAYWRAYRTWQGKLHRAYLGKSEELTLERLQSVAVVLASKGAKDGSLDVPGLGAGTSSSNEASSRVSTHRQRVTGAQEPHEATFLKPWLSRFPAPLPGLIGREREVRAICDLLSHPEVRLLTITGTGGVGKTRLAIKVANQLRDRFADGVCFVDLAPISDPTLVISSIAQELGLQEGGAQPLVEIVKAWLRYKQLLLLLDNFEQVISAASLLEDLLATCHRMAIMITSREVLRLPTERLFPVPPLALPDLAQLPEQQELGKYAAVSLFLQRARALKPNFQLTPADVRIIAEICMRLDGLPLAIELAAARTRLLPPKALLDRLSQRFQVLTRGSRAVPERHQTLRNTIHWSYDLLKVEEQRLFRRLSVFVGGCTLEAAEAVCGPGGDASVGMAGSVLDGVASLIDKNMLRQTEQEWEESRLSMLETIREFGRETLIARGEAEVTRRAHAAYYLTLAEEAEPRLTGAGLVSWLERLQREHENLLAALKWLMEHNEQEVALRLSGALWRFWLIRGHLSVGRTELARALAACELVEMSVRAKALCAAGVLAVAQGAFAQAEDLCGQSLALFRELDDPQGTGTSLIWLGYAAWQQSNYGEARSQLEEVLVLCRKVDDQDGIALALSYLATVLLLQGEYDRARTLAEEAVALNRERGDTWCFWQALWVTALVISFEGNFTQAHALLEESLTLSKQEGSKQSIAYSLFGLGTMAILQGDILEAQSLFKESQALLKEVGDRQNIAQSLTGLAWVSFLQGDYAAARRLLEESLPLFKEAGNKWFIAGCLTMFAALATAVEEWTWAARLAGAAEALCEAIKGVLIPSVRAMQEFAIAVARDKLGERAFAAAWDEGHDMTPEQALAAQGPVTLPEEDSGVPEPTAAKKLPAYPDELTDREVEVLRFVAKGLTDRQTARHQSAHGQHPPYIDL